MRMVVKTEHELLAESLGALRERLDACLEEARAGGSGAEALAAAVAKNLATITTAELPAAAHVVWAERVARPLKADPGKPLPQRAFQAIRSWPAARAAQLEAALADIAGIVIAAETDAQNEIIYAEISREYS